MEEDLLDDALLGKKAQLVLASKEKRLINFVVDYFALIIAVSLFYVFLDGLGYSITPSTTGDLKSQLQGSLFYLTYYLLVEGLMEGRSLGKLVTKTRVLTIEGHPPEVMDIIARSFIRIVPFEPFSFLGSSKLGWHDRWSKTLVIDELQSVLPDKGNWEEVEIKE